MFSRQDAICLANAEANLVLEAVLAFRKDDNPGYVPSPMVQQTKEYLERFSTVKKQATASEMRTCATPLWKQKYMNKQIKSLILTQST